MGEVDNQQQRSKTMKDIYGKDIPLSEEDMREMSRMSVMESLADFLDIPSYLVKKIWYDNKRKVRNVYIEGRREISHFKEEQTTEKSVREQMADYLNLPLSLIKTVEFNKYKVWDVYLEGQTEITDKAYDDWEEIYYSSEDEKPND